MRTWLLPYLVVKKNVQGLAARSGVISTARLGAGTSLSHGNLPALGGVIKRLAPFLHQLRVSPPPRAPRASCQHRAASLGTTRSRIALGTPRGAAAAQFGVKSGQFGLLEECNYPQTVALCWAQLWAQLWGPCGVPMSQGGCSTPGHVKDVPKWGFWGTI